MLTDFQKKKLSAWFRYFDHDEDGYIDVVDWIAPAHFIRGAQGWNTDHPKFRSLCNSNRMFWNSMLLPLDSDRDGRLTCEQFMAFWDGFIQSAEVEGSMMLMVAHAIFQSVDLNDDDKISPEEFALYLKAFGYKGDAQAVFAKVDLDGNGHLDIDEMVTLLNQFLRSEDPDAPGNWLIPSDH